METEMASFLAEIESTIARWHGLGIPNDQARRMAADLENTIRAFAALRGTLKSEDEPASFEVALNEARENS
jgi:hypothetical protein